MGYYSTVFFACNEDQHELISAATKLEPCIVSNAETSEEGEYFCCEWNGVKWGYGADSTEFETLLHDVEIEGHEYPFGFIRIGEDDEDVEYIGDPWNYGINYTRYLEWG